MHKLVGVIDITVNTVATLEWMNDTKLLKLKLQPGNINTNFNQEMLILPVYDVGQNAWMINWTKSINEKKRIEMFINEMKRIEMSQK